MTSGKTYTLTLNDLVDGSVSKNVITKTITKTFQGKAEDKTSPKIGGITVYGENMIEVIFTDQNRMDQDSMANIGNYEFDKDISVLKAEILRASKPDESAGKTVILTTSTMEKGKTYKLTIDNIADEFGNVITTTTRTVVGKVADIYPPAVTKVNWLSLTEVELVFDERVDIDSANDPANYSIMAVLAT